MRLIRRCSAPLLLAALLCCIGSAWAQEGVSTRDWISIHWDFGGSAVEDEVPSPQRAAIQTGVRETLARSGIEPYYGGDPDYDIDIGLYENRTIGIKVDPRTLYDHLPQSPILFAHPLHTSLMELPVGTGVIFFSIPSDAPSALEAAQNLLVGMSLYSIDRCDLADEFFAAAETKAAELRAWEHISDEQPDQSALIAFYRGACAIVFEQYEQAQAFFERALMREDGEIYFSPAINLAWVYLQLGKPDEAFSVMDDLVDAQTHPVAHESALEYRSQLHALGFRYTEAIADMDVAIALNPDSASLYVERGQRIMLTYEWDRALADYNYALELDPDYADAYYYRGVLYASVPEGIDARHLALADFQRYLELIPEGNHAADAARFAAEIQAQLDALD
jgi:tetratricopeptide (TPR) repeat protein